MFISEDSQDSNPLIFFGYTKLSIICHSKVNYTQGHNNVRTPDVTISFVTVQVDTLNTPFLK
jgi:hypothetical protein